MALLRGLKIVGNPRLQSYFRAVGIRPALPRVRGGSWLAHKLAGSAHTASTAVVYRDRMAEILAPHREGKLDWDPQKPRKDKTVRAVQSAP